MVCGATSDAGKTTIVAGLCRLLARRGIAVAPFKAQNMALNSAVTPAGHEIGRAQAAQAFAAEVEPDVAMNPILLKPTGERTSQVVVNGVPWKVMDAAAYHAAKPGLLPVALDALADLRRRFDVVICEGAGSPAEINLLDHDIVNLRIAREGGMQAIVVGDINLGGVFASLYGTVALLPDDLRACVAGLVINKLRGDPALLGDGPIQLARRCGIPVIGVVPWIAGTGLDAEDSMALARPTVVAAPPLADELDVAVISLPRISNFTDVDPLLIEPGVRVRFVHHPSAWGDPDLVILPGSKATVDDLAWLRASGLAARLATTDAVVLGICAGYQMLGTHIDDDVESRCGRIEGLGLLPVDTTFAADKVTMLRHGTALGTDVDGYQIHHGHVVPRAGDPWLWLDDGDEPTAQPPDGVREAGCYGTTLHGLFEADEFRRRFLSMVGARRGKRFVSAGAGFAATREAAVDTIADVLGEHLDIAALETMIAAAAVVAR
jgi:adenosylcobyric acid synthase